MAETPTYNNPQDFEDAFRGEVYEHALTNDTKTQCISTESTVLAITKQWQYYRQDFAELRPGIESLWFQYCCAGMTAEHDDPVSQCEVVLLLARIKDRGDPRRERTDDVLRREETAQFESYGVLWTDVPLFESGILDMLARLFRDRDEDEKSLLHWKNLSFLAIRISSGAVYDLRACAVIALRDILEEELEVTVPMLEVLLAWTSAYGMWLQAVVVASMLMETNVGFRAVLAPGSIGRDVFLREEVDLARFRFWRSRLGLICQRHGEGDLARLAESVLANLPPL